MAVNGCPSLSCVVLKDSSKLMLYRQQLLLLKTGQSKMEEGLLRGNSCDITTRQKASYGELAYFVFKNSDFKTTKPFPLL